MAIRPSAAHGLCAAAHNTAAQANLVFSIISRSKSLLRPPLTGSIISRSKLSLKLNKVLEEGEVLHLIGMSRPLLDGKRLTVQGLQHAPACLLRGQSEETMTHLLRLSLSDRLPSLRFSGLTGLVATCHQFHPTEIAKTQLIGAAHGVIDLEAAKCCCLKARVITDKNIYEGH